MHRSMMCRADPRQGRYLAGSVLFRGHVSAREVDDEVLSTQKEQSSYYTEWIPNNIHSSMCSVAPEGYNMQAIFLASSSSVKELFKQVAEDFTALFRRKAFLHWYENEGMDEMEFTEAESNMNDLVSEYPYDYGCTAEEEGEFDEEYDDY